jgi:flagellar basal body-associated protein FliL
MIIIIIMIIIVLVVVVVVKYVTRRFSLSKKKKGTIYISHGSYFPMLIFYFIYDKTSNLNFQRQIHCVLKAVM